MRQSRDKIDVNVDIIASYREHQMLITKFDKTEGLLKVLAEQQLLFVFNSFD